VTLGKIQEIGPVFVLALAPFGVVSTFSYKPS